MEQARRLEMLQNLLQVMRICLAVVLSYLDARLEPRCPPPPKKNFSSPACCCMLLLKCVAHHGPQEGLLNLNRVNPAQ